MFRTLVNEGPNRITSYPVLCDSFDHIVRSAMRIRVFVFALLLYEVNLFHPKKGIRWYIRDIPKI